MSGQRPLVENASAIGPARAGGSAYHTAPSLAGQVHLPVNIDRPTGGEAGCSSV
jgi:hypothetical protein